MFPYLINIKSSNANFDAAIDELLKQISTIENVVRVVFFAEIANNEVYSQRLAICKEKIGEKFLFCIIAQKPLSAGVSVECEVAFLKTHQFDSLQQRKVENVNYFVAKKDGQKSVFSTINSENLSLSVQEQSDNVFGRLLKILEQESMPIDSIVRQWNYIEHITDVDAGGQRYQQFNDARSSFYAKADWFQGYPAATGIGVGSGGVIVEVNAVQGAELKPIDNALQVPAHKYSDAVLKSGNEKKATSPKFERAKLQDNKWLYISGTAAIRGEKNVDLSAADMQTQITLENINDLLQSADMTMANVVALRVYVKRSSDFFAVKQVVDKLLPNSMAIYSLSDVCRPELLVEIEGIAQK
ncbi:MAG: hypothetical protein J6U44_02420 [Paludibacteraceae bacterium]|nr:hypothetical protein [Paludibacteraceae bacterium]